MGVDANDAYVGVLALGQGQRVNTSIHGCVGGQDGRGDCRSLVEKGGVLGQEEGVAVAKGLTEEMGEASGVRGLVRWVWFCNMEDVNFVGPRISAGCTNVQPGLDIVGGNAEGCGHCWDGGRGKG